MTTIATKTRRAPDPERQWHPRFTKIGEDLFSGSTLDS